MSYEMMKKMVDKVVGFLPQDKQQEVQKFQEEMEKEKKAISKLSFRAPLEVAQAAEKGLEMVKDEDASRMVVYRAKQLANREMVPLSTLRRIVKFFEMNNPDDDALLSMLRGGPAGLDWAKSILDRDQVVVQKHLDNYCCTVQDLHYYESGVHSHSLVRNELKSRFDGPHPHLFILETIMGEVVPIRTEYDGAHEHSLEEMNSVLTGAEQSAHRHVVRIPFDMTLPNGQELSRGDVFLTEEDGAHPHQAEQLHRTNNDAGHEHKLIIQGTEYKSANLAEYMRVFGPFDMGMTPDMIVAKEYIAKVDDNAIDVVQDFENDEYSLTDDDKILASALGISQLEQKRVSISKENILAFVFKEDADLDSLEWVESQGFDDFHITNQKKMVRVRKEEDFVQNTLETNIIEDGMIWVVTGELVEKQDSTEIQSLVFPKNKFGLDDVKDYIAKEGFNMSNIDESELTYQVVQSDEEAFEKFRTLDIPESGGVRAIAGIRKEQFKVEKMAEDGVQWKTRVMKEDLVKRIVTSVVIEPETVDGQKDIMSKEEIRRAAYFYLTKSRVIGDRHQKRAQGEVVESYIAPVDFTLNGQKIKKGSWVISIRILDDVLWKKVEKGEYTGVSVGGFAFENEEAA